MGLLEWFKSLFWKSESEKNLTTQNIDETVGTRQCCGKADQAPSMLSPENPPSDGIEQESPDLLRKIPAEDQEFYSLEEVDRKITEKIQPSEKRIQITPKTSREIKVWVGIDFGTSFTKLAYRVLGSTGKVLPLDLRSNQQMPYAIPSLVAFDDGRILFGNEADRFLKGRPLYEGARYLKILFAGEIDKAFLDEEMRKHFDRYCANQQIDQAMLKPGYLVAAFLAHTLREVKIHLGRTFGNEPLINFNVCIPIDTYEKKDVKAGFQRAINVAEVIEKRWSGQRAIELLENAASIWERTTDSETMGSRIHLVPEAVAQMACYVSSLAAEKKIHGVIDFGAGTTDFSIFNLCELEEKGTCAYWYNAVTFPGGMTKIEDRIATWSRQQGREMDYYQLQSAMENISSRESEIQEIVRYELQKIWEESRYPAWGKAYSLRRKESDWHSQNVKIFVCGGGSRIPYVKRIFRQCWYTPDWGPYEVSALTAPFDFGGNPKDFPRLAVAYGLTIPRPALAEYVLPKDCPDQTPPMPPRYRPDPTGPVYDDYH